MRILFMAVIIAAELACSGVADDGAALYKQKCASCHGAKGEGRAALRGSNLLTAEAKQRSDEELAKAIAEGGSRLGGTHAYGKKGVTAEQVKLLVGYVRQLQAKAK